MKKHTENNPERADEHGLTLCEVCNDLTENAPEYFEIIMSILSGTEVSFPDKSFVLEKNDIMLIPSGMLHSVNAPSGNGVVILRCKSAALYDNPALCGLRSVLSEPLRITAETSRVPIGVMNRLTEDIRALCTNKSPLSEAWAYIKLLELLTIAAEAPASAGTAAHCPDRLLPVLAFIDNNYMYDISLDDLALMSGYSRCHFSRLFGKLSGTTLSDYLNRRRIREAVRLLSETDISVTDAAMKSGFSSLTTFNRVFKQLENCTPSEYKKRHRSQI